ncbi:MAG: Na/Pi cotransporter family protein, partial [Cetobacterium sp.]
MIWAILIDFIGSLGIFLYALELVSKESQKVFGENIKEYLKRLTENKYKAIATGVIVTGIVQSSSVVSVLIVNLVNSGILNLRDSIGLILGTNIGTTVTGWIFSIKITVFSIPLISVGSIIYFFSNKEVEKSKGKFIFGFGLLLLGLQYMSNSINPLRNDPNFIALFTLFKADTYFNIIKVVAIGAVVTAIIQSSSAAVGIILALGLQGLINLETILALVLGANIGTTITPIISALNSNYEAKRTAMLCFFIKFILAIFFILIFPVYVKIIETLTVSSGIAIKTAVANTFVNVINTVIFLPFFGT